ncbi:MULTISPECIES: hypothetical protein [unclassified Methylobacterium]|uniref:hypothetical protein n=1 Tax=unclassified Methylobacterium TaxID=2615210 RepID=UPI0036FCF397
MGCIVAAEVPESLDEALGPGPATLFRVHELLDLVEELRAIHTPGFVAGVSAPTSAIVDALRIGFWTGRIVGHDRSVSTRLLSSDCRGPMIAATPIS